MKEEESKKMKKRILAMVLGCAMAATVLALLTDKQKRCLQMHLFEDFSLSEISTELGISRHIIFNNQYQWFIHEFLPPWQIM